MHLACWSAGGDVRGIRILAQQEIQTYGWEYTLKQN